MMYFPTANALSGTDYLLISIVRQRKHQREKRHNFISTDKFIFVSHCWNATIVLFKKKTIVIILIRVQLSHLLHCLRFQRHTHTHTHTCKKAETFLSRFSCREITTVGGTVTVFCINSTINNASGPHNYKTLWKRLCAYVLVQKSKYNIITYWERLYVDEF